jgi:parvulin-like peptidyl-prolyl isomerase
MKARAALLAFIILAGCGPAKEKGPESPVLARVNQAPVSVSRFKEKLRFLNLGFSNLSGEMSVGDEAKLDLLSQLIDEEMYLQEAMKLGIEASGSEVDARLAKVELEFNGDFRKVLKQENIDIDELKEDLKRRITAEKLINSQVYSKIRVDVTEAKAYFEKNRREFRQPLRIRARQIVVDRPEEARHIMDELKKGANFAEIAKARSLSPDSAAGGDLGYFSKGEMPPQFEAVMFRMKPGRTSEVVKTPYGYHIFKVEEVVKAQEPTFREAEVIKRLAAEKGEELFARWHDELKARTKIEVNFDILGRL